MKLTDTQIDVLRLIAQGRHLGDYVPRYQPGKHRGRGAFPATIAERATRLLLKRGLVQRASDESQAYFRGSALQPTEAGLAELRAIDERLAAKNQARGTSSKIAPPYLPEDLSDAVEHTSQMAEDYGSWPGERPIVLRYLGRLTVEQIRKKANGDDFSSWMELDPGDDDRVGYRGEAWLQMMHDLASRNAIPPIILTTIPNYGTIVGDGRGRVNFANATNMRLPVYVATLGGAESAPNRAMSGRAAEERETYKRRLALGDQMDETSASTAAQTMLREFGLASGMEHLALDDMTNPPRRVTAKNIADYCSYQDRRVSPENAKEAAKIVNAKLQEFHAEVKRAEEESRQQWSRTTRVSNHAGRASAGLTIAEWNRLAKLVARGVWAYNMRETELRIFDRLVERGLATREDVFTEATRNPPIYALHYRYRPTEAGVALARSAT